MGARFWDLYQDVRSVIQRPTQSTFLHTSIGAITVHRFAYRAEAGVVFRQVPMRTDPDEVSR
jgi:hypothetical protein